MEGGLGEVGMPTNTSMNYAGKSLPRIRGKLLLQEPMSLHTSFKIGGPADIFAVPNSIYDLRKLLRWSQANSINIIILGAGTNMLVSDKGVRGMVIELGSGFGYVRIENHEVRAGGGAKLSRVLRTSLGRGLSGLEGVAGIPGTVGGAVCTNAGTPAGCIADCLAAVKAVNAQGEMSKLPASELEFRYRGSALQDSELVVVEAMFRLRPEEPAAIDQIVESLMSRRRRTQPAGVGTAGSVFKNPSKGYAGEILDGAGAKGMQVGGARVSKKHANFIENTGNASAEDVRELMVRLQKLALDKCGVALEPEIQLVGGWQ